MKVIFVTALLLAGAVAMSTESKAAESLRVNPIRKVVTMLQNMQKKITAEGKKAESTFEEYMCYCKNADGTLAQSIADAENKIPQLESSIKEELSEKKQLKSELTKAKADRADAKETLAKAEAIRNKENKAYKALAAEANSNIGALSKAIPAIEQGMGSFLQTGAGAVLKRLSVTSDMSSADRDLLAAFLENGDSSTYAPKSGEIVGILKQMKDEMDKDFAAATADEEAGVQSFAEMEAAKKKEIDALTKAIESKTTRIGDLSVKIAETENDLEDTKEGLAEDKKFLANLDSNCEKKKAEWEEFKKMQAQELVALADTIKVLNDDDALELFKKTLPSAASSFMQLQVSSKMMKKHALSALKAARRSSDPRVDFVQMALHGGKMGFDKIIAMIDGLVGTLKTEQTNDDEKKAYCLAEFDKSEDKAKELKLDISDLEKALADGKESVETLTSEIAALVAGIKKLDAQVAEATATRKQEHDEYVETLAANSAAKDVLGFAKNRLNKFYNPKLYKAPPKRELTEEERITVNNGGTLAPTAAPGGIAGTGISAAQVAPPPPPEANLAYKKSGESSNGVIAMIDLLVADIDKEIQVMEVDEKDAQKDYEGLISDSADKRATDSKSITDKESAKAETEAEVEKNTESKKSKMTELMETDKYIAGLHQDCDWLLSNFDARKSARTGEIDALGKAKDVLSGADYSLVQTQRSVHLRGVKRA